MLYAALNCIYLQDGDDIHISLGQPYLDYKEYSDVLSKDEMRGVIVCGYMAQGHVKKHGDAVVSACVHTNWIFAHMLLAPTSDTYSSDFGEAIKLAERASETLCLVSIRIGQAALDLAEKLGIKEHVVQASEQQRKQSCLTRSIPCSFRPPVCPPNSFIRRAGESNTPWNHTETRVAFELEIMDIVSFFLCIAERDCLHIDEIMLCTTGMR